MIQRCSHRVGTTFSAIGARPSSGSEMLLIPITDRFRLDGGGWQGMKQAGPLHKMGRVTAAKYEPPLLEGRVREGEQEFRSGLKILSVSNVENLCTCRESRQRGMICA